MAKIGNYEPKQIEPEIVEYWEKNEIYKKAVEKNKGGKFYFLDGPPYTTGEIHVGHAWNKALKDSFLRYKRMQGFQVRDQPGFDMHGLPIEVKVEQKLGIKDKHEIVERIGMQKFVEECEKFALDNMFPMIKDFKRMGVWMDWENPYMTITNEYIEGAWWALKKASANGLLYRGEKAMTWCPRCATALAKHELEYENVRETSIFVKFKVKGAENEYLIIWTTTPWTIPFNLAVMVNPKLDYVKAKVGNEIWITAKALASGLIGMVAGRKFEIIEEFKGKQLSGLNYEHPFADEIDYKKLTAKLAGLAGGKIPEHTDSADSEQLKHLHSVILSQEYVDTSSGSGLVHCAPGCGPEDYEIGRKHGLPAFNNIDEHGIFPAETGKFSGLKAKQDDDKFIEELKKRNSLIETSEVEHEYAHCWRCKTPVIFRATKQWFLATERLKGEMIKENERIVWVPDWAGLRWFNSWLSDLQDWCISRQRFWGIPLPIWECQNPECGALRIVESRIEIKELAGKELDNLHRPWIDEVIIKCEKCGSDSRRIPDVLDVWLDSGASPWATLNYPSDKSYEEFGASDFILEGKDQIRGWFNSLMALSMVSFKKPSYKAVYMHGMIMDAQGRKMSKSLENVISPYEVIDKYGSDVMRYYMIGGAKPGLDLNYNFDDMKVKLRNLAVLWNLHKFVIDYSRQLSIAPHEIISRKNSIEENYILSKLNSSIQESTQLYDHYYLNQAPEKIEELFLELSRTYIQMVRDKSVYGSEDEKRTVLHTVNAVLMDSLRMTAPISPFIAEKIYLNLKEEFGLQSASIHLEKWPKADERVINLELEKNMDIAKQVITSILAGREKLSMGVRWPIQEVIMVLKNSEQAEKINEIVEVIKSQTNVKEIKIAGKVKDINLKVKPDYSKLGPEFGKDTPQIIAQLALISPESILQGARKRGGYQINIDGKVFEIRESHLIIEKELPEHLIESEFRMGELYLNKTRTKELEAEGYARELMRRIQDLRKKAGLEKVDEIVLEIVLDRKLDDYKSLIIEMSPLIKEKVGAKDMKFSEALSREFPNQSEEKIKGIIVVVGFEKV